MAKDYYKTLGVERDASKEEIKAAYKRMAKKYHPDINKDSNATEKFKEINEAASVLGDEKKRDEYNRFGTVGSGPAAGPGSSDFSGFDSSGFGFDTFGGEFDFGDIFDAFTGGGGFSGFGGRRGRRQTYRGNDLRYDLEVSLEEAATGIKKSISITKLERCATCDGKGYENEDSIADCIDCKGTGRITRQQRTPFGIFQSTTLCGRCHGEGKTIDTPCKTCHGEGRVRNSKKLEITVPAGVDDNTRLKIAGEGEGGPKGGSPGDLYLFISVSSHRLFERNGDDLELEVPISFSQAALGDEIEIPTIEGKAKLRIPPGTQTNTIFRMKDKGIPHLNNAGKGTENVKVVVETPKKLTRKQRELLEEFAHESGTDSKPSQGFFSRILGRF
jgi:molecular chaperone DnaJ